MAFSLYLTLQQVMRDRSLLARWQAPRSVFASLPGTLASWRKTKHKAPLIEAQVAEVALSLAAGLRSGQSVVQSLYSCVHNLPSPVGETLRQALQQYETGVPINRCLGFAGDSLACRDFEQLVRVVALFERLGSDPVPALQCVAESAHARSHTRSILDAKLSEVRFSAWIVSALPLVLGLFTLVGQPGVVSNALKLTAGRVAYATGALLWVCGTYLIWRLSNPTWL